MIPISSTHHPVVLVVEDEAMVRTCIAVQLEDAGFAVIEAANAEEALRQFERDDRVTTVFTDINMPGRFDGLALARRVSEMRPKVQLIVTSGRDEPPRAEMPAGVQFLPKPYHWQVLKGLINAA
jgi:CheY-like chemotaxis protein